MCRKSKEEEEKDGDARQSLRPNSLGLTCHLLKRRSQCECNCGGGHMDDTHPAATLSLNSPSPPACMPACLPAMLMVPL